MTSFYWILLALFILIGSFQIYLVFWDRRIHYHSQNLTDGKLPTWRHGRCWWYISSNDDQKWFHGPGARAEWSFFLRESFALDITVLGDEDDDIQFHIGIPYIVSFFFTLERLPFLETIPYKWRRTWGYQTSVKFFDGALWIHVLHSDMWGSRTWPHINWARKWKEIPKAKRPRRLWKLYKIFARLMRWIDRQVPLNIWLSTGYEEWRGVGFYISFHFNDLILGRRQHEKVELWPVRMKAEIPIEPDNSLGFHYFGSFMAERHTWWRAHFPWFKKTHHYVDIRVDEPPLHAGKGENSYDLDDDGIFGMGVPGTTIETAIAGYQKAVKRDREKYGFPNNL